MQAGALVAGAVLLVCAADAACAESLAGPRPAADIPSWFMPGEVDVLAAKAEFRNARGEVLGRAVLTEAPYGVTFAVEVSSLPPGRHGFHIHEVGRCDPPDFASAGGHFDPRGKRHGLMTVHGPHVGDLPNLVAGPDGVARAEIYLTHATLGAGSNSLFHPNGTALIIHASPDDERTDPGGNAGARIACGVIAVR
jgi:superoxide dismutase, Cu-Zn family